MGDTIGICPPLVINEAEIGELLSRLGKTLDATREWARSEGLI